MKWFSISRPLKNDVRFEYDQWKMSVSLLGFPLVIKLRNLDFEIHWNTSIFFAKEYMMWDLNIVDFISVFGFTLFKKLRNTDFESHWNALIFFDKKDMMSDLNISHENIYDFTSFPLLGFTLVINWRFSNLKVTVNSLSDLVYVSFFGRNLTASWQTQILDFIEIVFFFN